MRTCQCGWFQVAELEEKPAEHEETEHELQDCEAKLEQMTQERDRPQATIRDLDTQLNKVPPLKY